MHNGANDNGCGPISQPIWGGTPRPGSGHKTVALTREAGMLGCWGALGCPCGPMPRVGLACDSQRGSSMRSSKSLLGSSVPIVTLIPIYEHRRTCGQLPALSIRKQPRKGSRAGLLAGWGRSMSPCGALLTSQHPPGGRLLSTHRVHLLGALTDLGHDVAQSQPPDMEMGPFSIHTSCPLCVIPMLRRTLSASAPSPESDRPW